MGVVALIFFVLIFYNRITRIVSAVVVTVSAFILLFTFERWERQADHLYDVTRMIRGYLHYQPELGNTILWAISLLFGLVVAVFMLYRFSFYLLTVTGVAIFLFTWGPGFTRDATSFLIFLVCFCLLLIRKTNSGLTAVYVAAPICAALVWFVQTSVPMEADLFQRRTLQELFDGPLAAAGDFIYMMTNPMYFSFQSTGFSGQGGRLGGPVTPNTRNVMTVQAPGRTYLAGATHNTYTGYSWITTLESGQLYTQGMHPNQFEMLETTAALIRSAAQTHVSDNSFMPTSVLWSTFPVEDHMHLSTDQFLTLGFGSEGDGLRVTLQPRNGLLGLASGRQYLHAYLPMSQATVAIGTNRTGTIFRPQNTRNIWFHPAGPNYLPSLVFDPTGDMRAPGFMARGTQYTMNFLNVDHRLSFVGDMLNTSYQGFNANPGRLELVALLQYANEDIVLYFYEIYLTQNPDDYTCNLTYATLNFVEDAYFEPDEETPHFMREFSVRVPRDTFGIPEYDVTVTAQDINDLFEMFAFAGPNRELKYIDSFFMLHAKLDAFSRDVLTPYVQTVREHFMYVPEMVPQRVHDLVAEIVYGLETDYERIMAIRDYLIQFPYTLSPQPVPPGVCFVDHFLFVGQEGYCTYYASAMAIMSRIAGVPSRYIEGFLLPPAPPESEDGTAIFVVTNMMAHAWVEVYLEGFGWLIVEATAPYAFFMDQALTLPRGEMQPGWFGDEWWWELEEYYWYLWGDGQFPFTPGGPISGGTPATGPYEIEGGTARLMSLELMRNVILLLFAVMIVAIIVFLTIQYIRITTVVRRIRRMPVNQQITAYFTGILAIASHVTSAKDPAETPYVYGQRVGMRFAFKNDSARLRDLVQLYYRARYSSHQLSQDEGGVMEESYFDMINYLRVEHKKSHYFYLRYILRIGAL